MNWLFLVSFIATIAEIASFLEEHMVEYFNTDLIKHASDQWQKHRISFQNTLSVAMQESFGFKDMNIYINRPYSPLIVSKGYYHTDNQVHFILQDITLEEFPHISDPKITFPLISNVIKLEAPVSKMFLHSKYIVFRNTSNIVYDLNKQNAYETSPFLFEQVQNTGQLAMTVEGCKLSGIGITTLTGRTVSLGNTVFRLHNCHFNFEIYNPGVASPPVIADYLPNSEGLSIERLIMRPLCAELTPKLQAALQTYVNTSAVFLEKLPELRLEEDRMFEHITNYVNNVIRNLNVLTISRNLGKYMMDDFIINWNETFGEGYSDCTLALHNMVLTGLETVYSSHTGGPFKLKTLKVSEELRFGTLQVRGSIEIQVGKSTIGAHEFAAEINDVEVDVTCNIEAEGDHLSRAWHSIEVMGWRSLQFSSPGMTFDIGEAFITGYLLTKVPIYLTEHLNSVLSDAALEADNEYKQVEDMKGNEDVQPIFSVDANEERLNKPLDDGNYNKGANIDYDYYGQTQNRENTGNEPIKNQNYPGDGPEQYIDYAHITPTGNDDQIIENENYVVNNPTGNIDYENNNVELGGNLEQHLLFDQGTDYVKDYSQGNLAYPTNPSGMLRNKKNLRMRRQKQRRLQKKLKQKFVKKATRTVQSSRIVT